MSRLPMLALLLVAPFVYAEDCPWMPTDRIDTAYPDRAPWSTMAVGQGRCKFVSDQSRPASMFSLTQIIQPSAQEAKSYVATVGGGMAKSYKVAPLTSLGDAGVAVRQDDAPDSRMLTLIGHRDKVVVMTQLSFHGGVDAAQQATAAALTAETFTLDTGGGLQLPKK